MTRLTGIKAITFDVDGTLWDFDVVMRRSLHQALLELERLDADAAAMLDVDKMIAIRDRVQRQLKGIVTDLAAIRLEGFKESLKEVGRPNDELADRLNEVYFEHRWRRAALFDDVLPALGRLREKYILGALSNGNSSLKRLGLEEMFQFALFSQDHGGVEKPAPRLFEIALDKAGCSAEELLHVGDSLETDVAGAANAGVRSVWLNRNGHRAEPDIPPHLEISSLRSLVQILRICGGGHGN